MVATILSESPDLTISPEKLCFIIVKAREWDGKVDPSDLNHGSNAADDGGCEILEDYQDDPTEAELEGALRALNDDEAVELIALSWLGRGDFDGAEWTEAVDLARERHTDRTVEYLLGMPDLPDCLEEGLALIGRSCSEFAMNRL